MSELPDLNSLDDEWAALGATWRQADATPDLAAIHAGIRRTENWQKLTFVLEMALALATMLLGALMLREPWPANLVGATIIAFGALGAALALWVRRGARQSDAIDVRAALDRALRQARVSQRWAWSGLLVAGASLGLLAVLGFAHAQPTYVPVVGLPFAIKATIAGAVMLLQAAVSLFVLRRSRRYRRSLETLRQQMSEG